MVGLEGRPRQVTYEGTSKGVCWGCEGENQEMAPEEGVQLDGTCRED